MVLTPGHRWCRGRRDKRNGSERVNGLFLGADREAATLQAAEYQLESNANQRYLRKLHVETDRTQQLSLLDDTISVQHTQSLRNTIVYGVICGRF